MAPALTALALATAAHAGFQVTVTVLVYPRLAATPAAEWERVHRAHSRGIAPLVVLLYGALVMTGSWAAYDGRGGIALWIALAAAGGAMLLTAVRAAPLHGRLGSGPDPALLAALLRTDRWRAVLAVVAVASATTAVLTA